MSVQRRSWQVKFSWVPKPPENLTSCLYTSQHQSLKTRLDGPWSSNQELQDHTLILKHFLKLQGDYLFQLLPKVIKSHDSEYIINKRPNLLFFCTQHLYNMWINTPRKWGKFSPQWSDRSIEMGRFIYYFTVQWKNIKTNSVSGSVFSLLKLTWNIHSKKCPLKLTDFFNSSNFKIVKVKENYSGQQLCRWSLNFLQNSTMELWIQIVI